MRGYAALLVPLLLAGCSSEPSFDERYQDAEKAIRGKAATMDAEMAEQERMLGGVPTAAASKGAAPAR